MKALLDFVNRHRRGATVGIVSVCSAHPDVLRAAMTHAQTGTQPLLIESTSNQVNQFGGYTGMRPADFRDFVYRLSDEVGLPRERLILGGDHLGPNCWQAETPDEAMARSEVLIAQYVEAGFRKIHLDCSMPCAGDPAVLSDEVVAARAARLAHVAETAWARVGGEAPVYVVGTEVPVPGGAHEELDSLAVTRPAAAQRTLAVHQEAFAAAGAGAAWARVIGLVVQPGVEFDHDKVIDYRPDLARELSAAIADHPGLVYEAHSTDYQTPGALSALVRDHFAILKVGPGLTFALREALWSLVDIEREWLGPDEFPDLRQTVLSVMQEQPVHWKKYYQATDRLRLDLQYSLSDRIRYYWSHPRVVEAARRLLDRLERASPSGIPMTLISQCMPWQYEQIRAGRLKNSAAALLDSSVHRVLQQYALACNPMNLN
ncbi:D-tagatose-bisphosphate aldolase, class II, non-catalytic subunit [Roseateles sp.]|uniref:D-tagatose-bisphosphate aldolase, class II, non-catalytic subunit n=1 Tax=Roseateles sp. TaxID=1971397 RepID=UPI0025F48EEC|nr:D-tagatose-bisphosphate aldolase, class II, non-catalytic subunit [Roseateles sp.]MBV8035135.1 D-tagatose-bisphosphate aldolase, class II, non-catalytic subunit [Roseateles sp.]